jgi:hypothetical protein
MSTDTILRAADPLDPADLDPQGPMAFRVRAGATAPPTPRARTGERRARLALAAVSVTALAAVAVALALPGGSGGGPADARAALITAAEKTAAFTSGQLTWHMAFDDPRSIYDVDAVNVMRYEGDDVGSVATTTEHGLRGKRRTTVHRGGYRLVDGVAYVTRRDGSWKREPAPPAERAPAVRLRRELDSAAAFAQLVRAAAGVTTRRLAAATGYRATIAADAVPKTYGPGWRGTVAVSATVGDDGIVRAIALRDRAATLEIAFDRLGQPQGIVAP